MQKETKMAARETRMKPPMTSLKTHSHPCLKLGGGGGGGGVVNFSYILSNLLYS